MIKERVLLFGGSGKLGKEMLASEPDRDIFSPRSAQVDIRNVDQVVEMVRRIKPDVVINLAAVVGAGPCEKNRRLAWDINVVGARNAAIAAQEARVRYVYTSTNSVFDGEQGNYKEDDFINPTYFYALTKAMGEESAATVDNHAVVRLDFFPQEGFKYRTVFADHFTSKIPADEAARKVWRVVDSLYQGAIHIGQPRDSLYNILSRHFSGLEPTTIAESTLPNFPRDLSFDLTRWNRSFR